MIKANKSPVLTSNNFGFNYANLSPNLFKKPVGEFKNFSIKNSHIATLSKCPNFQLQHPISKGLATMRANARFKLEILKSSSTSIVCTFKQKADEVMCSQIVINTNKNVQAKLVLCFYGTQDSFCYNKILFKSEENSVLDVLIFCDNGHTFLNLENQLMSKAKVNVFCADFSKKVSISNIYAKLCDDASFDLNCLYLTSGFFDQNFLVDLSGKKSKTNITSIGALDGEGQKTFRGTINFLSGAKQSVGHEKEFCLLLSEKAGSKSLPMLLCTEEDAEGSHSSSSGQVDEGAMFYLMSRGFSKAEAKTALVRAKFQKQIDKIFDERTKNLVLSKIEKEF